VEECVEEKKSRIGLLMQMYKKGKIIKVVGEK
jgi:hypothetical protein